jgi:hypothetical protein
MKLERRFDQHEEMVASSAESVLRLIEAGRSPDTQVASEMLGLPLDFLERELESQTLHEFVWRCARRKKKRPRR